MLRSCMFAKWIVDHVEQSCSTYYIKLSPVVNVNPFSSVKVLSSSSVVCQPSGLPNKRPSCSWRPASNLSVLKNLGPLTLPPKKLQPPTHPQRASFSPRRDGVTLSFHKNQRRRVFRSCFSRNSFWPQPFNKESSSRHTSDSNGPRRTEPASSQHDSSELIDNCFFDLFADKRETYWCISMLWIKELIPIFALSQWRLQQAKRIGETWKTS